MGFPSKLLAHPCDQQVLVRWQVKHEPATFDLLLDNTVGSQSRKSQSDCLS
jgi:hypothetical protein